MLPAGQGLLSGAERWTADKWDILLSDPVGSGMLFVSNTSHRRHGNTGAAWDLCIALDILNKSTVHSAFLELV